MVVILLLPPYSTNGCDGRSSNDSSSPATTASTTSTGDTAIPAASYAAGQYQPKIGQEDQQYRGHGNDAWNYQYHNTTPTTTDEESNTSHYHCFQSPGSISPPPPPLPTSKPPSYVPFGSDWLPPPPPPAPEPKLCNVVPKPPRYRSQPTLETILEHVVSDPVQSTTSNERVAQTTQGTQMFTGSYPAAGAYYPTNSGGPLPPAPSAPPANNKNNKNKTHKSSYNYSNNNNSNYFTNTTTTNYVRHVTRVNFYDVDTSQVEYESRDYDGDDAVAENKDDCDLDDDNDCNIEAITKEEEWITKRKTELTTTRQIETHVKRQIRFEDGKVIEDSGPIVSTNTTEDTDKQETETTEKHDLGLPLTSLNGGGVDGKTKGALPPGTTGSKNGELAELAGSGGTLVKTMVPRPADGLVREINDKRVVSHEETKNYIEVEDVQHRGDFSDEAFVKAVTSGVENVEEVLFSPDSQKQLVPTGPRVVANKTKSFKTIDSEDVVKRSLAQEDGKIITEQKKTTEHEIIVDKELSDDDEAKSTGSQERVKTLETNQRFFKQRDEQHVDLVKDGKVVGTEMKYAAETMQMDNDDMLERPDDWDSLSDRMRKMRKPYNKSVMQHPKAGGILMDRKDALTKRPLDFDREEETRKGETIKWLESHFGSESTASNDSREDETDVIEPTKRTYFNVTIKSNQNQSPTNNTPYESGDNKKPFVKRNVEPINGSTATTNGAKYYQGISNWSNRKEPIVPAPTTTPANHFASKAFRDDLHASIERSQLRKNSAVYASKDNLNSDNAPYVKSNPSDSYVSREDILQQKRQSLSSQFLARSRQNSRDRLDDVDRIPAQPSYEDDERYISGSRTDLHYGLNVKEKEKRSYTRAEVLDEPDSPAPPRKASYVEERAKSYERTFVENNRYNSLQRSDKGTPQREIATLERPVVPQRRRNGEKKLRQQHEPVMLDLKTPMEINVPPPDYSPPPRSRSSSPHDDFHKVRAKSYPHQLYTNSSTQEQLSARETSTLMRKQNQRTRFARNTPSPPPSAGMHHHHHHQSQTLRPSMLTQTTQTQTTPSTISTSTVQSHRSSKVGSAIGNSLRKLVGKLRSASVERKLRMKSKSKSRDHSPAPPAATSVAQNQRNITTYQQYNVIDGHIGGGGGGGGTHHNTTSHEESEDELSTHQRIQYQASKTGDSVYSNASADRRAMLHSTTSHPVMGSGGHRDNYRRQESLVSPKQRYYLGEDPYSSTLYGKENVQDNGKQQRNGGTTNIHYNGRENNSTSSHTLGRYQKGNSRFSGSTPNLNSGYRTTQTLPRKLNEQQQPTIHQYETQTMNISRSNVTGKVQSKLRQQQQQQAEQRIAYQPIGQNTGPLKPARTYAKSLNRSKSFSVHAMNGSNDPSPIYMEKLNGNSNNNYHNNLQSSHAYKSNPHLYSSSKENSIQQTPLKSPSIVNLISRSQRDLTKIGTNEDESDTYGERQPYPNNRKYYDERKATPPYRSGSHIDEEYKYRAPGHYHLQQKHSLDSRGSVEINKDTASIIRHEEYVRSKRAPPPAGSTIIKVRNMDYRK
ncbi:uncharacterized protein LOC133335755 [Musca vetustissima]|uniref:uncharacterized protein LOC133335755 n=1 Tax=Musca vetustissima TaxID=27455 RepID=UPI002AB6526D|nr:uncharacterized protein LOC133335755 [Musca vetustissima]